MLPEVEVYGLHKKVSVIFRLKSVPLTQFVHLNAAAAGYVARLHALLARFPQNLGYMRRLEQPQARWQMVLNDKD